MSETTVDGPARDFYHEGWLHFASPPMAKNTTPAIKSLYYITHIDNLPSIVKHGILSHQSMDDRGIDYTRIYDAQIVSNRKAKTTPAGKSLWAYANCYFQPRNPMLFRVIHEKKADDLAVLGIQPQVMAGDGVFITTGNAANGDTEILPPADGLRRIDWKVVQSDWWNGVDGSKRKIVAECLTPDVVPPYYIHSIFVANQASSERIGRLGLPKTMPVLVEPKMFFRPAKRWSVVAGQLSLAEGDMFFSEMQTLAVSVNIVGIMGKGVASRAKYQFPDVYVMYQDACRQKLLRMGQPYLYKRESSVDEELADEPSTLAHPNASKWFLLFATKKHWRDNSDLDAIAEGLRWLKENYKNAGIRSLALPALGCGLGNLEWKDVGPVMCRELAAMDIPVVVYLPQEHSVRPEWLTADYLLSSSSNPQR